MLRCRAFAEELGGRHGLPVSVEQDLREVGFGAWEGSTPEEVAASDPDAYAAFYRDPVHARPAGAEPLEEFFQRASQTFSRVVEDYQGKRILIVSHAGIMRAILASVLGGGPQYMYRIQVDNAGITRFRFGARGVRLLFHNLARLP